MINIKDLKKKIIYRANYRGTKEMDKLLGAFANKYVNILNDDELIQLSELLDLDDENLYKYNQGQETTIKMNINNVSVLFKNYVYVCK